MGLIHQIFNILGDFLLKIGIIISSKQHDVSFLNKKINLFKHILNKVNVFWLAKICNNPIFQFPKCIFNRIGFLLNWSPRLTAFKYEELTMEVAAGTNSLNKIEGTRYSKIFFIYSKYVGNDAPDYDLDIKLILIPKN